MKKKKKLCFQNIGMLGWLNTNYKVLSEEISSGMKQNKLPTVELLATYFKFICSGTEFSRHSRY
jgi:hypothetical protein